MFAATLGQTATNNQVNASVGLNFIENDVGLVFELRQYLARFVKNFAFIGAYLNNVAEIEFFYRCFKDQCPCILHGVEENGCDFVTDTDAAGALVWYAGYILAKKPQHRVGSRFTR